LKQHKQKNKQKIPQRKGEKNMFKKLWVWKKLEKTWNFFSHT
jgi:hypothetical protein